MSVIYLKKAEKSPATDENTTQAAVQDMLKALAADGEDKAREYAAEFDQWEGDMVLSDRDWNQASERVPAQLKDDIQFAHDNVRRFAQAQRDAIQDTHIEVSPGVIAGHRNIPLQTAGCYVPGGRYAHIASAIMSVTTAKVAGVKNIIACSVPRAEFDGIHPAVLYALKICGANAVLNLGGVQGIAALAYGMFGNPPADILVGPGNQYVAEAKRILYGKVAIDMFAGPTESMVIADGSADPEIVAWDLVGQAEHGYNSPVWLISLDRALAEKVLELAPGLIAQLPEPNQSSARNAWNDYAEIALVATREDAVRLSDQYASEHLQVQCDDLDWWLHSLSNYGSLFLGEETNVSYGDKISGPNHILPTKAAARYTGGLSVGKFLKTVTWQRMSRDANKSIGPACARISRFEGMEGHAKAADIRLQKWFPQESFELDLSN